MTSASRNSGASPVAARLIVVRRGADGLGLERVAVGEHLLLGGDNVDLALARLIAERSAEARGLDAARWQQLTSLCRDAKERLLGDDPPASVAIAVPGRGRSLIKGTVTANLSRDDVLRYDDVELPGGRLVEALRSEQDVRFFGAPATKTLASISP